MDLIVHCLRIELWSGSTIVGCIATYCGNRKTRKPTKTDHPCKDGPKGEYVPHILRMYFVGHYCTGHRRWSVLVVTLRGVVRDGGSKLGPV